MSIKIEENSIILYKYLSYDAFIKTIETWSLKASLPYEVNDPLENVVQSNKYIPQEFLNDSTVGRITPFFSFSRNVSTSAMWGLYAENGHGVCLVFSFPIARNSIDWFIGDIPGKLNPIICDHRKAVPVIYQKERLKLSFNAKKKIMYNPFMCNNWINNNIAIKGESWEYESEVRIFSHANEASSEYNGILSYEWPMHYFVGIVVGPRCKHDRLYIQRKIELCQKYHAEKNNDPSLLRTIIVTQARSHDKRFEYEAPPFFDKMDGFLLSRIIRKNLHYGLPGLGCFRNWNDRIIKIQDKLRKKISRYEEQVLSCIRKYYSEEGQREEEIEILSYYLTRCLLFNSSEKWVCTEDVKKLIRDCLLKAFYCSCNSQSAAIDCSFLGVSSLDDGAITKILNLLRHIHEERENQIEGELEKMGKKFILGCEK